MEHADVLIVGGGPAGSACAGALVAEGRDALVIDAAAFPRDKPCAGWITPEVVAELPMGLEEYAREHTLQPISRFRVGRIGGRGVDVDYARPVSYGIRREELDAELLHRSGARVRQGERVQRIRREGGQWELNDSYAAPVLVGAGGHFCPVARLLNGSAESSPVVVAREIEYRLQGAALERCRVDGGRPELDFCRDLEGYGWCFRKGDYLNVGLGRRNPRALGRHVAAFVEWLVGEGRLEPPPEKGWRGHAYRLRAGRPPRPVADGALLVGDAAGLAFSTSGEGILPAMQSGRLAARAILEAGGEYSEKRLRGYVRQLDAKLGLPPQRRGLPAPIARLAGAALLASPWFTRRVVLDGWFLHRNPLR
ncbi:MAG: NAD(P)/FAD-dependent oxidoreductase [Acidobacteria bacterium]|nr:NAD(P)/FAD-dependent oxidoreductase [Acidobacteriota bacterium]